MFNQPLSFDTSKVVVMHSMFEVTPTRHSLAALPHCALPSPDLHIPRSVCPPFWQHATAFNQPLSFDTSRVSDIHAMFEVPSARALLPVSYLALPLQAACAPAPHPPVYRPAPRPAPYAAFSRTRQNALAFNQPLSFDTSSVRYMSGMFKVCSERDLHPIPYQSQALSCRLLALPPQNLPSPTVPYALLPTRQHATTFNQPLSFDTSKVSDMHAMFEVPSARALRPVYSRAFPLHAACSATDPRP